jgi:hypothetical protein
MKYYSTSASKNFKGDEWTVVSWDKGAFPADVFKMMMGHIYGALGSDCHYDRENKKFFVKMEALDELTQIVDGYADDFTPNENSELAEGLSSLFN